MIKKSVITKNFSSQTIVYESSTAFSP